MTQLLYTVPERFYSRLAPCADPACGCTCLLWQGAKDSDGYGRVTIAQRRYRTHRVAWIAANGPIPDGLTIDHVKARGCRHPHCANIAHLEPVTQRENLMRGTSPSALNAVKDRCKRGHEFDDANTYIYASGIRKCRTCRREHGKARYWRDRQAVS